MKSKIYSIFTLLLCLNCLNVEASQYEVQGKAFSLNLPTSWAKVSPNDTNFIVQGPPKDGVRSVIFISHTGLNGVSFNPLKMESDMPEYYSGRKEYVESKGGKILQNISYKHSKNKNGIETFMAGVNYDLGGEIYHERTQYISCKGSVFQVKTLDFVDPKTQNSAHQIAGSFSCAQ